MKPCIRFTNLCWTMKTLEALSHGISMFYDMELVLLFSEQRIPFLHYLQHPVERCKTSKTLNPKILNINQLLTRAGKRVTTFSALSQQLYVMMESPYRWAWYLIIYTEVRRHYHNLILVYLVNPGLSCN